MSRDPEVWLHDIRAACEKILRYTSGLTKEAFLADEKAFDATIRNLEIIGEASKNLPDGVRHDHPTVP